MKEKKIENKYFATYKGNEIPFIELYEYLTKEYNLKDITRQQSIKTIGFYTDLKEVIEKIKGLEWIVDVNCYEK